MNSHQIISAKHTSSLGLETKVSLYEAFCSTLTPFCQNLQQPRLLSDSNGINPNIFGIMSS